MFYDKNFVMKHSLELIGKTHPAPIKVIDRRLRASRNVVEEIQRLEVILEDQVS